MRRIAGFVILALLSWILSLSPAVGLPPEKESWLRVETDHFLLFGNTSKRRMTKLGQHLEHLHDLFAERSTLKITSPLPTTIYVFKNDKSLNPYNLGEDGRPEPFAGYFVRGPQGNYVAVDAGTETGLPYSIINHEYLHYILENSIPGIPLWLNEGLAEVYSNFEVRGGKAQLGLPIESHLYWLSGRTLIPLEKTSISGPNGFLLKSIQGSRMYGAAMETSHNGVRSTNGGGFAGMEDGSVGAAWRQKGRAYQHTGHPRNCLA